MKISHSPKISNRTLAVISACLWMGLPVSAHAAACDVDNDGDVDRQDIKRIVIARDTGSIGPGDPRDADGDGKISMIDARVCIKRCSLPNCKITGSVPSSPADDASRAKSPESKPIKKQVDDQGLTASGRSKTQGQSRATPGGSEWRVKRGDTLWAISRVIFPGDARRQAQLRQDIVKLNPSVFAKGASNMAVGVVLRLPDYAIGGGPAKAVEPEPSVKSSVVEVTPKPEATESPTASEVPETAKATEPVEETKQELPDVEEKTAARSLLITDGFLASAGYSYGGDEVVEVESGLDIVAGSGAQLRLGYERIYSSGNGYRAALGLQYNVAFDGSDDASLFETYLQVAYQYREDNLLYGIGVIAQSGAEVENDVGEEIDYDAANGIFVYMENVGNDKLAGWGVSFTSIELDEKDTDETADASRVEVYYTWRL